MAKSNDDWETVPAQRRGKKRQNDIIDLSTPEKKQGSMGRTASSPFVLILVGLPGSGKSYFATRLEKADPRFVRINQDVLKTRKKCEALARKTLVAGKVAVIDRSNFNVDQRKTWVDMAKENNVRCECIVFETGNKDVYISRCQQRKGHETVHPSKAAAVVSMMTRQFMSPVVRGGEKFHRLERISDFNIADSLAQSYLR